MRVELVLRPTGASAVYDDATDLSLDRMGVSVMVEKDDSITGRTRPTQIHYDWDEVYMIHVNVITDEGVKIGTMTSVLHGEKA